MTTPFTYDFGYSWPIVWGHLVPILLFGGLAVLGARLGWRRSMVYVFGLMAIWGVAGLLITHFLFHLNLPQPLPTERFLASGEGRVIDVGAGSGRATVGLLLARPRLAVTALDLYSGYFGIEDNTPGRLMANAQTAGVAGRAAAKTGDARELPFANGEFEGAISVAAIDHLPAADIPKALAEVSRVLKPGGEFLLLVVNVDGWAWVASPHAMAHHRRVDASRWRSLLEASGFEVVEQGTKPATLYFLGLKRRA